MRGGSERSANRYTKIVESIFHAKYEAGQTRVDFEPAGEDMRVVAERHYRLVPPDSVTPEDLRRYGERLAD